VATSLPPAGDWVYRGEGAANLVVAYRGADARWRGTVLRIRKGAPDTSSCEGPSRPASREAGPPNHHDDKVESDQEGRFLPVEIKPKSRRGGCDRSRKFLLREVVPRIGTEFVLPGAVASVDRAFLEALNPKP